MEMSQDVYENVGVTAYNSAHLGEGVYVNKGNVKTHQNRNNQNTEKSGSRYYRVTALCLLLLCVLLLIAVTVLGIKCTHLQTSSKKLDIIDKQAKLGWRYFNSSFYYISVENKNWTMSADDCVERGANLVIISSTEEQEFIIKQLDRGQAWIGLSDSDPEEVWKWVDGTNLTNGTGYWLEGEPNNLGDIEDCAEIWVFPNNIGWNDKSCSDEQKWICEKNAF